MIFDRIEWDDANLRARDSASKFSRDRAGDLERSAHLPAPVKMRAMSRSKAPGEAKLARKYQDSRDLAGFETEGEPVEVRRNVTISVRFSDQEIALLRAKAEQAGIKVTAYIRAAALEHGTPLDKQALLAALREASDDVARVERLLG